MTSFLNSESRKKYFWNYCFFLGVFEYLLKFGFKNYKNSILFEKLLIFSGSHIAMKLNFEY